MERSSYLSFPRAETDEIAGPCLNPELLKILMSKYEVRTAVKQVKNYSPEWITKSSCHSLVLIDTNFRTVHLNFCFALKPTTSGKSKDGSKPLEDLDEAEQLLEWVEVDLEGRHPLRERREESQDAGQRRGAVIPE